MHILVVEHDVTLAESLIDLLEDAGYMASAAPDFGAALARLREPTAPHVTIAGNFAPDHRMLSAFFEQVAADSVLATRRFIVLTTLPGALSPSLRLTLKHLGAPIIRKPFDIEDLLTTIRTIAQVD